MQGEFKQYIISLYKDIPQEVYDGLLSVLCIGLVVFSAWKGFKTGLRYSAVLLLVEYIFLLFCSTVFFRTPGDTRQYDFQPFWSYSRPDLFVENLMNVIVFIPIGMILGSLLRVKGSGLRNGSLLKVKGSSTSEATKSMTWFVALMTGMIISVAIEALQFFLKRGFSEVDDVMHNTLGCILGYILVKGARLMVTTD